MSEAVVVPPAYKIPESVLVVIHTPALEVLMLERANPPGFWQCVTGSKDAVDEPLAETARREVFEETGIPVQDLPPGALADWGVINEYDIYPTFRHRYAPGVSRNTEHVFGLTVPTALPVRLSPREHLAYRWLPWREAADLCFSPSNAEAILQLPAQLAARSTTAPGAIATTGATGSTAATGAPPATSAPAATGPTGPTGATSGASA